MRSSRIVIIIILLFLLTIVGWKVWYNTHQHSPAAISMNSSPITRDGDALRVNPHSSLHDRLIIEPTIIGNLPHHIELPAQIIPTPGRNANIYTPVTGHVAEVHVQPGQSVQKGDVLAILYSGDFAQAWSDHRKALSTLTLARTSYQRAKAVLSAGGNATKDMQSARNELEQAQAEATRTQDHLTALGADNTIGSQTIIAPFSGIIGTLSINAGQNITDTTSPLMTLIDTQEVWIEASLPESNLSALQSNLTLSASFEGQTCSGPVTARDPIIRNDTRRLNLYLRCANPQGLLHPGQFTTASLNVPTLTQILVPKTALLMDNDTVSVFVETAPDVYRRRVIDINYDEGDNVSVHTGLTKHDRIVTHGAILLNDH